MAAVLATTPRPLAEIAPLTPPALERIVSRCLAKDPEDRWQTARDVSAELQWVSQGGSRVGLPAIVTSKRRVREGLAWAAFAVAALAAVGFAIAWMKRAPEPLAMVRFALQTPDGLSNPTTPEISPDGRHVVFGRGQGRQVADLACVRSIRWIRDRSPRLTAPPGRSGRLTAVPLRSWWAAN